MAGTCLPACLPISRSSTQKPTRINGKVIVAGPSATGKTCLLERFVNDNFDAAQETTVGGNLQRKSVFVDDLEVCLFLFDTAGQERFADMAASNFRMGEVCLLCFDMNNPSSFDSTKFWMAKVRDQNPKCTFILVGTKEDLLPPEVQQGEAFADIAGWADESGISFFPTSAKNGGAHIKALFHAVAEKCIRINRDKQQVGSDDSRGMSLLLRFAGTISACVCSGPAGTIGTLLSHLR